MKSITKKNILYFSFIGFLLLITTAILAVSDPDGFDDLFDDGDFPDDFDDGDFPDDFDDGDFPDDFDDGDFPEEDAGEEVPDDFDDGDFPDDFDDPEFPPDDIPPEEIPPFPEPPVVEEEPKISEVFRIFVSPIRYPNPFSLSQYGHQVPIYVYYENNGNQNLDNTKVVASIPELGARASKGPNDLNQGSEGFDLLILELPEDVALGEYWIRFTFSTKTGEHRIIYRTLEIIK